MASIILTGTLLDPNSDLAVGDQIRFTHNSTTGETIQSAVSLVTIDPTGAYSIELQYGLILVEYKDIRKSQFKNLGVATVNGTNPATSLPELLNALVPVSSAELIEFQAILADCVTAQTAAENAATTAEAFAYQLTTTDLIASAATFTLGTNIPTSGFATSGDGGSASWVQNGVTGQTVSQSPAQLSDNLLNDANGNQWALVVGQVLDYNGTQWFPSPFGDSGNGGYLFDTNGWVYISIINDLSQAYEFATVAGYKAFTTAFPVGKIISILERQADFTIIAGTGAATGKRILGSDEVDQSAELVIIDNELNAIHWGGALTGFNDASLTVQPMADYSKEGNYTLVLPDGLYTFHTEIDLSSPGGGAAGYRDMAVMCGHEAKFSALNNTINIFNISGQRRFEWSGGWFRKANKCFSGPTGASPQPSDAYCHFRDITFQGESIGAIKICYSSTTPIGVYFTDCDFGTDASTDMIELAIEMLGNDVGQSNLFKATRCTFMNCTNAVNMPSSTHARFGNSFTDCRFEQLNGYAINAGTNTRDLRLTNCYFEACGSPTVKPIIMTGGKLVFDGGQIAGSQKNTDAFIAASAGVEVETRGKLEYLATGAATVFVDYASGISQPQYLDGVSIQGSGTQSYKSMLFRTATQADEQFINWEAPRLSSTLIDTQIGRTYRGNQTVKGFISHQTEEIQLSAQDTDVDLAAVNVPNAGNGLRVSVESYQTIQGIGHSGKFDEIVAHWDGATWVFTPISGVTTVAGIVFTFVNVDTNTFKIQAKRTVGGATNTPFRALVTIRQSANNMEGNEVTVS